jgi:replicative DNA helicase
MLSDLRESGCLATNNHNASSALKSLDHNKVRLSRISTFSLKGIKPTYCLEFENKTKIYLTSTHKILAQSGWIRISELTVRDKIYSLVQTKDEKIRTFFYTALKAISYASIQQVYDETIPVYHNYLQNNLILHNSIEQDADVVIMLYREDYYQESKEKEQITEVIIAKNRNGPVGTAKLMFDAAITTFKNL